MNVLTSIFFPLKTQRVAPQRHPTAPILNRPLKDQDVKEGQPIQLTCQVQGFPKSEVCFFIRQSQYDIDRFYLASLV